jgi:hypothetical protein
MINTPRKTYLIYKPTIYTFTEIADEDVIKLLELYDAGLYPWLMNKLLKKIITLHL